MRHVRWISLPWLVGGPFLAALAERHRYRTVMVVGAAIIVLILLFVPAVYRRFYPSRQQRDPRGFRHHG